MTYTPQAKERMVEKNFWGNNNYLYCLPIELYLELTRFSLTGQAQLALAIKEQSLNHPTTLPDKQLSLELPFTPSYSLLTAFDDSNTKIIQLLNRFNEPPRCLVIAIETSKILNQFDTDEASIATCNKKGNYLAIGIQDKKTRIPRVTVYNIDNGTLLHKFSLDFKSKIYNMLFLNNNILRTEVPLEPHPLSSVSVKDWDIHTGKPVYEKIIQANKTFFIGPIKITHNVGFSSPLLRRGFYHSDALTITFDRTPHSKIKIDRPNQQDPLDYFIETRDAPYWCMPNTQESMYALVKHCEAGIHYAKSEVRDLRASRILALFDTKPDVGSLPAFSHDSRYIAICNHGANSDIRVYTLYENDEQKIDPLSNAQPVPNLYTFLKTNNSLIKILALQKMYEQNNNLVPIEAEFFQLLPIKLQRAATLLAQSGPKQSTKINITLAK